MNTGKLLLTTLLTLYSLTGITVHAGNISENSQAEIEHLLDFVGESGCVFNRNGSSHDAEEAEDHLRMKFGNGKRYVSNAEDFIDRIASKSSWSGSKYTVECPNQSEQPSGEWLNGELQRYRGE